MRKSPKSTNEAEIKFSLRVPQSTYERFRKACDEERRSINSQVVLIMDEWLAERVKADPMTIAVSMDNVTLTAHEP